MCNNYEEETKRFERKRFIENLVIFIMFLCLDLLVMFMALRLGR